MPATSAAPATLTHRLTGWLGQLGVSPAAVDDTLSLVNPLLTVHRLHARVVERVQETPSALSLVLQAGHAFAGVKPGQFLMIGVTIRGVRHRRAYSPRAIAGQPGRFAITIQRQPGGLVSGHVHEQIKVGDIIEIEQPAGDFTLPAQPPAELLLIAGGSGITPGFAMLQHLQATQAHTRVTLIYFARSAQDRIFGQELAALAQRWPQLRYLPLDSNANTQAQAGRNGGQGEAILNRALLDAEVPRWAQTETYCCGPAPLMNAARELWAAANARQRLHLEAFAAPQPSGDPDVRHAITLHRDRVTTRFEAPGNQTLLVAGEQAGHAIKHGCRQGICHECTCRLNQGAVKDLDSGDVISAQGQTIRLCVSAALSDLELDSLN